MGNSESTRKSMPSELFAVFLRSDIHPCNKLQLAFIPLSARHLSHCDRLARLQIPRTDVGFDGFQSFPAVLEGGGKENEVCPLSHAINALI